MRHPSDDDLALAALGETEPARDEHLLSCPDCAKEVDELKKVVRTARHADFGSLSPAPPSVWDRVADELGLQAGSGGVPSPRLEQPEATVLAMPPRRRLASASLAAAAAVAVVLSAVGLSGVLSGGDPPSSTLSALGDVAASGEVQLREGAAVTVSTSGLPETQDSHYEVWLLDPTSGDLVSLGPLRDDGTAELEIPPGVAAGDFPVIDISAEPNDGDPSHSGDSVLRASVPA